MAPYATAIQALLGRDGHWHSKSTSVLCLTSRAIKVVVVGSNIIINTKAVVDTKVTCPQSQNTQASDWEYCHCEVKCLRRQLPSTPSPTPDVCAAPPMWAGLGLVLTNKTGRSEAVRETGSFHVPSIGDSHRVRSLSYSEHTVPQQSLR